MTPLNPTTSLCMIYLRAYVTEYRQNRNKRVRAEHLLRMHWSVCATDARGGAVDGRRATKSRSEGQDSREGISGPQIAHVGGTA